MKRLWLGLVGAFVSGLMVAYGIHWARAYDIPTTNTLTYTGTLYTFGQPDNSSHSISLALFVNGASSSACGTSATSIQVTNGAFSVPLPSACVAIIHQNQSVNVEVTIDGIAMGLEPMGAVPYAVEADTASNAAPGSALANAFVPQDSPTGEATLPSGTTAQRSTSPTSGMMRLNTTTQCIEVAFGGNWYDISCVALMSCTKVVTSTLSETSPFAGAVAINYTMVGGGGGSGGYPSGAAGAAGTTASGTFTLTAGATLAVFTGGGGGYGEACGAGGGGAGGSGWYGGGGGGNAADGSGAGGGGGSSAILMNSGAVAYAAGGAGGTSDSEAVPGAGGGTNTGGADSCGGSGCGTAGAATKGGNGSQGGLGGSGATGGNGQPEGGNGGSSGANGSTSPGSGGGGGCGGGGGGGYGGGGGSTTSNGTASLGASNWATASTLPAAAGAAGASATNQAGNGGLVILSYSASSCSL